MNELPSLLEAATNLVQLSLGLVFEKYIKGAADDEVLALDKRK